MLKRKFGNTELPLLSFGTMRLPTLADGSIDEAQLQKMVDYAMEHGCNYFDTAYPYHGGMSEVAVGRALSHYPRESYYLATKYPGHQISDRYDPEEIFEEQLRKCGVDYFDFYLLHNVYENSIDVYLDERWGILDYFRRQKQLGRIKHLGFSTHGRLNTVSRFLDTVGEDMEFCQIQLNWLDWTLQDAESKVALLNRYHMPIWVMEPVRGGMLCRLPEEANARLADHRPEENAAAWGLRFLEGIPGVTTVLSGMSSMEQMMENIRTYETSRPLGSDETAVLMDIAEGMKRSVPCTACRYCTAGCPMGLDIPALIATFNDLSVEARTNSAMWLEGLPEYKLPSACIVCGKCEKICPQAIGISGVMRELAAKLETVPKWSEICRKRAEEAKRLRGN